jgi:hypothetical protein
MNVKMRKERTKNLYTEKGSTQFITRNTSYLSERSREDANAKHMIKQCSHS